MLGNRSDSHAFVSLSYADSLSHIMPDEQVRLYWRSVATAHGRAASSAPIQRWRPRNGTIDPLIRLGYSCPPFVLIFKKCSTSSVFINMCTGGRWRANGAIRRKAKTLSKVSISKTNDFEWIVYNAWCKKQDKVNHRSSMEVKPSRAKTGVTKPGSILEVRPNKFQIIRENCVCYCDCSFLLTGRIFFTFN